MRKPLDALLGRDLLVPALFTTFLVGEALLTPVSGSRVIAVLFALVLGATFVPRKRFPLTMLVAATVVNAVRQLLAESPDGSYAYSIALPVLFFGVAAYGDRGRRVPPLLVAALVPAAYLLVLPSLRDTPPAEPALVSLWLYTAALATAGAALGLTLRDRRNRVSRLRERVRALEDALPERSSRAAAAEQRRLAVHVHRLVTDLVQRVRRSLDQADRALGSDRARAVALLERTADSARGALAGMRSTLDRLRADDGEGGTADGGSRAPETVEGASIEDLAARLERLGARVALRRDGAAPVPTLLLMAAERVADLATELLGGAPRGARLACSGAGLRLELRGPRQPGRAPLRSPAALAVAERVRLLGGTLAVERWRGRVLLELPLDGAPAARPQRRGRAPWRRAVGRQAPVLLLLAYGVLEQSLQTLEPPLDERLAFAAALPLPLLVRTRHPLLAIAGVQTIIVTGTLHGTFGGIIGEQAIAALTTAFTAGVVARGRVRVAIAAALALVGPQVAMLLEPTPWPVRSYIAFAIMLGAYFAVGRLVRDRLAAAAEAQREIAALIDRAEAAEERAAARERARLAREIHDVVGHAVLVVCVQSGAAETLAERDPGAAREAIESARSAAATAVSELGRLSVVMPGEDGAGEAPGVAEIPSLVESVRNIGREVELRFTARARLAPEAGAAVYRIVQEALTNAGKHAPSAPVQVEVEVRRGSARVRVANAIWERDDAALPGGGHGLRNMRERTLAAGGSFEAGPDGAGLWVVRAAFPPETTQGPLLPRPSADAAAAPRA